MAREGWGMPPWEIEEQVSELWADRWLVLNGAEAAAQRKAMSHSAPSPGRKRLV
jgi:hypothetical protein